ncbi:MAG: FAD binding domain-containing protein [Candidatus Nanopelagicales bacterium]
MIPVAFDYTKPSTVDEAVQALVAGGEDAKVISGGQSLMPVLRLRMAAPTVLVDVGGIAEMNGVSDGGDHVLIGANTTHHEVMNNALVKQNASLLAMTAATVADPQIRHRGTLGGSLAHADPAGDLPTAALALDCVMVAQGPKGRREIAAKDFFVDYFTSALEPDEILVAIKVPKLGDGWGCHYEKFNRTAQAWATVGVAAAVKRQNGTITEARVALTNMGPCPVRASSVESALAGASASTDAIAAASANATDGTRPTSDLHASAEFREHLAKVLTKRAVATAAGV